MLFRSAGIQNIDPSVTIKIFNSSKDDKNDIITEVFKSKAILVGSPTINNGYLYSVGGLLEMIRGLKFKNKKASSFGSYGWSGEAIKQISAHLNDAGFSLANDGFRTLWVPDKEAEQKCILFGEDFAKSI